MGSSKNSSTPKSPAAKSEASIDSVGSNLQRLQRVMAAAGIASRRECEIIIQEGRVEVDGQIVATPGAKVDPTRQKIFVDGERLVAERLQYFMLNKPPGVVSTSDDPSGRPRVIDLIKTDQRVYNVGRLDQSSEGLILVTNDGELANRLTHPRYGVHKKYHVQVAGVPTADQLQSLEEGVYFAEGKAKATSVKFLRKVKTSSWIEIVLAEGRNREIRRMLASVGHKVRTLKRVAIGPLKMGDLPVGAHRALTAQELKLLRQAAMGKHAYGVKTAKTKTPQKSRETASASGKLKSSEKSRGNKSAHASSKFGRNDPRKQSKSGKKVSEFRSNARTAKKNPDRAEPTPTRGKKVAAHPAKQANARTRLSSAPSSYAGKNRRRNERS